MQLHKLVALTFAGLITVAGLAHANDDERHDDKNGSMQQERSGSDMNSSGNMGTGSGAGTTGSGGMGTGSGAGTTGSGGMGTGSGAGTTGTGGMGTSGSGN